MSTRVKILTLGGLALVFFFAISYTVLAWAPVAPRSDPLVRMPGTQPGTIVYEPPD